MITDSPYDTIAAVSTPPGEGGIGIVRLSGEQAVEIVKSLFTPRHDRGEDPFARSFTMHLGYIEENGRIIDEVLVTYMKAPATYTREDVVEINCHGGAVAVNEVLRLVLAAGARPAEPGEFTKRAFINGRIDLTQAEAVLDIVHSKTPRALGHAVNQLRGSISQSINAMAETLKRLLMTVEAGIDFPDEEDVDSIDRQAFGSALEEIRGDIHQLIKSYDTGRILREGVLTVIAGKPNVGKSSILNAFLRYDRAIVTEIPGTTRDVIEEQLNLAGIPFILADTAGITDTVDIIELEGVRRSRIHLERAHLVLLVLDGSIPLEQRDLDIAKQVRGLPHITVVNKSDLPERLDPAALKELSGIDTDFVPLSALTGSGLKELEERMVEKVAGGGVTSDRSLMVTNARHFAVLKRALHELDHGLEAVRSSRDVELIAYDLRSTMDTLGEITGRITPAEIMDEIFRNFCIGK
jgi:tRNA modification GTPase